MIGQLLDRRYRVDAPIARGGMSTVYRGLDLRLDRPVAIKVMDPQFAADPAFVSRFEFEARSVARLKHPSLVAVYDQGHDGGHAFLVMELVEGGTLRELLRERGPMPPHAVAAVAGPVLDALAVAHRAGLVHRDVKPENVLVSDTGEVKIADFGLVRAAAASTTTSDSVILGTAAYLSPEQVTTGSADTRSDVYAMGVLIFELLTGRPPFTGDTSLSVAYQRVNQDVPRPSSFIVGVPAQFDDLVAEATHREPSHRFHDAAAMAQALRTIARELDLPDYRVPAPRRSAEHRSQSLTRPPASPGFAAPGLAAAGSDDPTRRVPSAVSPHGAPPHDASPTTAVAGDVGRSPAHHTRMLTEAAPRPSDDEPDEPGGGFPFPDYRSDRRRSRRSGIVWMLVVLLVALALGAGGWWLGSGRFTAVPATDGLDRDGAVQALTSAGLTTEIEGRYSDEAAPEVVLGTDPGSGARIGRGDSVALVVSLGRPVVPSIPGGGSSEQVRRLLEERTLAAEDGGEAYSTTVPVGGVAALEPPPGTAVDTGSTVTLVYSKGAPPVEIPDLEGETEAQARAELEELGLIVRDVVIEFDDDVAGGSVVEVSPEPGTTVKAGSTVSLTVSDAVELPSLLGRSVGQARDELGRLGLDVRVRQLTESDSSRVIRQRPSSGDLVRPGSTVELYSLP